LGDLGELFLMDVVLVILEQLILLYCEGVRLECYLETMGWLRRTLGVCILGFVSATDEIKRVLESLLLPTSLSDQ
jgi:hypothetical protein